ncbi:MAG: Glu-tRNA(Gln) amidotransferase subunit GatE [Candidatus Woesearchaeota archaeon]
MTDYTALGLKVGLEIHQQLDTNKLFCNCPCEIRDDTPDKTIKRILRAAAGETGTVDIAASAEMEKQKHTIYEYYDDTTCLVELDESPPLDINKDALQVTLQLAAMMHCEVVDEIHVMRKIVVDGSNTSGFQRTALIARNGYIEFESEGELVKVGIETVCLEEDAARIIAKTAKYDTYRLDRLGIPLIEIATAPDIKTPQQTKDCAAHIGMLLRSTGRVKRGLGTIRQDVNVSISGGVRVEIKGVQDLRLLDTVVILEIERQQKMFKLCEELKSRGITKENLNTSLQDYTIVFKNTTSKLIKKGLDAGQLIYGKPYNNFKGFFGFELGPNRRFGSELSDRIKLFGLDGLIHSDEDLGKYQIVNEVKEIYSQLNLEQSDGMIFIIGTPEKCVLAFKKIDETINSFLEHGLSKEVRNATEVGTSNYLRPMPGSSRMYPETDVKTIIPDISNIQKPELIKDKIERFEKEYGLPKQVAKELVFEMNFEKYVTQFPQIRPITIAETLVSTPKDLQKRFGVSVELSEDIVVPIFYSLNSANIASSSIPEILKDYATEKDIVRSINKFTLADESELTSYITQMIKEHPSMNTNAIMGLVMKQYRGKFSGQKILELIKKFKGE